MSFRALLFVLASLLLAPTSAAQDPVALEELQQRYDRLDALRASFTQVLTSDISPDSTRIRGRVLLQQNKYRVETPSQTVVTNGITTWIYSPADSQVVVNNADSTTARVTPQTFLTASTESYDVESPQTDARNQTRHTILTLTATGPSSRFADATLWIRQSDQIVTRIRATDRNGNTLDLRLHDIVVNPSLPPTPFTFSPPEGVEVIDLRTDTSD